MKGETAIEKIHEGTGLSRKLGVSQSAGRVEKGKERMLRGREMLKVRSEGGD